jgi:hypothetical protein
VEVKRQKGRDRQERQERQKTKIQGRRREKRGYLEERQWRATAEK